MSFRILNVTGGQSSQPPRRTFASQLRDCKVRVLPNGVRILWLPNGQPYAATMSKLAVLAYENLIAEPTPVVQRRLAIAERMLTKDEWARAVELVESLQGETASPEKLRDWFLETAWDGILGDALLDSAVSHDVTEAETERTRPKPRTWSLQRRLRPGEDAMEITVDGIDSRDQALRLREQLDETDLELWLEEEPEPEEEGGRRRFLADPGP